MIENGDLRLEIEKEFVGLYTALVVQKGTEHEDLGAKILLKDMKHNGFLMHRQVQSIMDATMEDL